MEIVSQISSSPVFGVFLLIVGAGVLISVASSLAKKGGEAAGQGLKYSFKGLFILLKKFFTGIFYIVEIAFLILSLFFAYMFNKK